MIQPGFMVLQSNRLENLRRVTVEWMRRNPLQPLENEVLLVQSNGIAQWLKLALAADASPDDQLLDAGCGIAAALDIELPGRFHWRAYRAVLGDLPETSPFDKPLLSWRLLRLLPQLLQEPAFAALQHFLADDHRQRKQFQLAQRLADLLDQYQIYRADWLNDWAAGIDQISRGQQSVPLPAEQRWQAALWRRLLQDIPEQARSSGRAQIHQQFLSACLQLSADTRPAGLPRRVVVFGLSSLPGQTLDVLAAIARCTQVLLCVHNPCMHYWGDIVDSRQSLQLFSQPYRRQAARADMPKLDGAASDADLDALFLRGNPLLAAWGKQGRDYIRLLDAHDERSAYEPLFQSQQLSVDLFEEPEPLHQLARLQGDIFHLRSVQESQEADEADREESADQSISFHIAHGVQREVEILQDHLLALFNADPTLRPRDVLVMVPDINRFAPSIQAVFGRLPREDSRYLPFTISDQGKRHQAPVYLALSLLLQLPSARVGVSELLDFLDVAAVQRAFDISVADKPLLHRWIEQAGIRWGFHGQHRQSLGMPATSSEAALEQNTWHFGLRRMLLGYAMGRDGQWQDIEAYDEIGGLSAALVGKLAHLLRQLEQAWTSFHQPATVPEWTQRLNWLLKQFFVATDDKDMLLLSRLEASLRDWQQACEQAQFNDTLSIEVVRSFLLDELDVQSLTQRFLAGSVNFATLMPMRAIPFRHICLLGMNDGDYPRQVSSVDFDLMRQDYRPGDRSRREDDRYLFLEALLSARESLYISWTGRSIHDNSERPPSVLLGQLRDYLADTRGAQYLASITHEYPLQPFSVRYFSPDSTLFTYAHEWSPDPAAVRAGPDVSLNTAASTAANTAPNRQAAAQEISLADLASLLRAPADVYFEHSLGVNFGSEQLTAEDHEVFALDGLLRWKIQQQLMKAGTGHIQLAQQTLDIDELLHTLMRRQQQSGQLPIPPFAERYVRDSVQGLGRPLQLYQSLLRSHQPTPSCLVTLSSSDGQITLNDQIDDIREQDSRIRCVLLNSQLWAGKAGASDGAKARIKWHYLARLWPQHLAAQLSGPVVTHIIGPDTREVLAALPRAEARAELQKLLDLWRDNLRSPLAACVKTSCAWLHTQESVASLDSARTVYEGSFMSEGEMSGNYALLRLWPDFDSLCAAGFSEHSTQLYAGLVTHWSRHRRPKDEPQ